MAIPIHRIMTLKSKIGFGKYPTNTLEQLFEFNKEYLILEAYYRFTNIDFNKEVLEKLKLTDEYRIVKPGSDPKSYPIVLANLYPGHYSRQFKSVLSDREKSMMTGATALTKQQLKSFNQNRR